MEEIFIQGPKQGARGLGCSEGAFVGTLLLRGHLSPAQPCSRPEIGHKRSAE